jgi:hypothetical protein
LVQYKPRSVTRTIHKKRGLLPMVVENVFLLYAPYKTSYLRLAKGLLPVNLLKLLDQLALYISGTYIIRAETIGIFLVCR